jgi:hypothetical protein
MYSSQNIFFFVDISCAVHPLQGIYFRLNKPSQRLGSFFTRPPFNPILPDYPTRLIQSPTRRDPEFQQTQSNNPGRRPGRILASSPSSTSRATFELTTTRKIRISQQDDARTTCKFFDPFSKDSYPYYLL